MRNGDIVLVHFPFADLSDTKIRPAVVVCQTPDKYQDVIVCMISSAASNYTNRFYLPLEPSVQNGLRSVSTIHIYRIATVTASKVLTTIGKLSLAELQEFNTAFQELVSQ